ncbi:response regulator [Nocardioides sp. C4-1]|uniref:response regulator transcription factor n=1 Tax=Nocardioides sp. C4-1 TaxID=3151851 RepID=UPI003264D6B4
MATILIADDDHDVRDLARRAMEAAGHDVVIATDGAEALARAGAADLALLDVSMPALDGWRVAAELRGAPHTRDLPIVVVSAMSTSSEIESALDAGADGYLTKPFVPFELLRRVEHLLAVTPAERRRARGRESVRRARRTA